MIEGPFQMPAPNAYWGRKAGSREKDGTLVFRLKRWAARTGNSGGNRPKHYTSILATNAIAKGWLNGERRRGKGSL